MPNRQVVTIDVTFTNSYDSLPTKEILRLISDKGVKNVSIKNVNKRKEK